MTEKEFLQEIQNMKAGTVKERSKRLNLPVIVFGAAENARIAAEKLAEQGVEVSGYAVDEKYYKPGQTYLGLPVYNFDELARTPKKHIFVNGIGVGNFGRVRHFADDESILKYDFASSVADITYDYVLENYQKFFVTYNLLEDDFSRKTMLAYLKAQITRNPDDIHDVTVPAEYFNEITRNVINKFFEGGVYLDCGAYTGDTIRKFIDFTGGNYEKIFAFEPNQNNFAKLENLIKTQEYKNVEVFNCGVWSEKTQLHFEQGGIGSHFDEHGDFTVAVDTIDNIVGDTKIDFIKMDIEGSELEALKGALKTLKHSRPMMAICVYHKKDDLIVLPQFMKNIYGNCRFYLRKHTGVYLHSLDLYVIPE